MKDLFLLAGFILGFILTMTFLVWLSPGVIHLKNNCLYQKDPLSFHESSLCNK